MTWRMEAPCSDCPFSDSEAGKHLARSLRPGRMAEIKRALQTDQYFTCHKTTDETGNGTNLVCAGALAWQEERGLSSNFQRVCEALDYFRQKREAERAAKVPTTEVKK